MRSCVMKPKRAWCKVKCRVEPHPPLYPSPLRMRITLYTPVSTCEKLTKQNSHRLPSEKIVSRGHASGSLGDNKMWHLHISAGECPAFLAGTILETSKLKPKRGLKTATPGNMECHVEMYKSCCCGGFCVGIADGAVCQTRKAAGKARKVTAVVKERCMPYRLFYMTALFMPLVHSAVGKERYAVCK
ncbi:hypothetical protein AOLI_G00287930 [Acnodon oligacanthus]